MPVGTVVSRSALRLGICSWPRAPPATNQWWPVTGCLSRPWRSQSVPGTFQRAEERADFRLPPPRSAPGDAGHARRISGTRWWHGRGTGHIRPHGGRHCYGPSGTSGRYSDRSARPTIAPTVPASTATPTLKLYVTRCQNGRCDSIKWHWQRVVGRCAHRGRIDADSLFTGFLHAIAPVVGSGGWERGALSVFASTVIWSVVRPSALVRSVPSREAPERCAFCKRARQNTAPSRCAAVRSVPGK